MSNNLVGKTIDNRYRVDDFLGGGGMADVYLVYDRQRYAPLAMKILRDDLAEDKVFIRRFKREADTLARLNHPNIVHSYGLKTDGSRIFILMDYVDGWTLRKEIAASNDPLPMKRVREVIIPICSALSYAHHKKKIHCDIKPANIMIHKNGTILLTDFGIAREAEGSTTSTLAGAGTPAYMAPEQARGEEPTPQTDIYSLGIVFYEMLTGEKPFVGDRATITGSTSEKVRWEHTNLTPIPPRRLNPRISLEMETVVLTCLSKNPDERYPSVGAFMDDVEKTPDFLMAVGETDGDAYTPPESNGFGNIFKKSLPQKIAAWWSDLQPTMRGVLVMAGCLLLIMAIFLFSRPKTTSGAAEVGKSAFASEVTSPKSNPSIESIPPTYTPQPTYTPLPTYTLLPAHEPEPVESVKPEKESSNTFEGLDVISITEDDYEKFNSLLISQARKHLDTSKLGDPGTFSTSFELRKGVSYGLFAFCSEKEEYRSETVSKLHYAVEVDGTPVNIPASDWIYKIGPDGKYCLVPAVLVTNIQSGTHTIVITEKVLSEFSGHIGGFSPGDYRYDLRITFK